MINYLKYAHWNGSSWNIEIVDSDCLYLTAKLEADFLKLTERIMYSLLGVIND